MVPGGPTRARFVNAYWSGSRLVTFQREGERVTRREHRAEFACFIHASHATEETLRKLRGSRFVTGLRQEGDWVRVQWVGYDFRRDACAEKVRRADGSWGPGAFEALKVPVFEGDVSPVRRWLTDSGAGIQRPRRVYLDLETDSRVPFAKKEQARILCWSLVEQDGDWSMAQVLRADTVEAERELLAALWTELERYDQVASWNGDRFDFPVLEARTDRCRLGKEFQRWLWLDHLVLFRRMNASASESGDEKQSMSLGAVAKSLKVEGAEKLVDLGELGGPTTWDLWQTEPERLRAYCLDDSAKMKRIEAASGYIELLQTLCDVTDVFPDTFGINPTQQVEGFMMRLGAQRGIKFPTMRRSYREDDEGGGSEFAEPEQFRGAFVMEPKKKGVLRGVHVADFARLYPSVITTWNMSIETWQRDVVLKESAAGRPSYLRDVPLREYPLPAGCCAAPITDVVFRTEPQGVLPEAVSEMLRLRKEWDKKKALLPPGTPEWKEADRRSAAYKIAANSFYGVVGSPFSRFFEKDVAESVAQGGVWLIKETIKAAEAKGMEVVYGDTDSIFVLGSTRSAFESFVAECNAKLYPGLVASKGCKRNDISIAYEKAFERIVFVTAKRYAGQYLHYKGSAATADSKPEIKGLEFKRGDSARLARRLQEEVVYRLVGYKREPCEDPAEFEQLVLERREHVLNGVLPLEDIVLSKRLTKTVSGYKRKVKKDGGWAAQPPHVEVARVLQERGRDVGAGVRIEYVVVDGSTSPMKYIPAEDFKGEFDRFHLWEDLVYPPTLRVLEAAFPAHPWKSLQRVRPPKPRAVRQRPVDGSQGTLF